MKGKLSSLTDEEFIKIVKECDSFSDIKRKLGYTSTSGGVAIAIKKRVNNLGIDTSFFTRSLEIRKNNLRKNIFKIENILVENSTYTRCHLKNRLITNKIIEYKCSICGNKGLWNNSSLSLELDHINGINNDNRKENLRFLCPNCHSQTETFSGKNKGSAAKMVD